MRVERGSTVAAANLAEAAAQSQEHGSETAPESGSGKGSTLE
jgi:hypothetical protein